MAVKHNSELEFIRATKPVVAWCHEGGILSCGTTWLTISSTDGSLLLRLGKPGLEQFYRLLCRFILYQAKQFEPHQLLTINMKCQNHQLGLCVDERNRYQAILSNNQRCLTVDIEQLKELRGWLTVLNEKPLEPPQNVAASRYAQTCQLDFLQGQQKRSAYLLAPDAVLLRDQLLLAASLDSQKQLTVPIGHDCCFLITSGDACNWPHFDFVDTEGQQGGSAIAKHDMVRLAAQIDMTLDRECQWL